MSDEDNNFYREISRELETVKVRSEAQGEALDEVRADVKQVLARQTEVLLRLERGDGRMQRIEERQVTDRVFDDARLERIEADVKDIKQGTSGDQPAQGDSERVSLGGIIKLIGAIAAAVALIVGAYVVGHVKGEDKQPQPHVTTPVVVQ